MRVNRKTRPGATSPTENFASPPDLTDPAVRAKLSAPGFRGFAALTDWLDLTINERCRLLGDVPPATYHRWVDRGAPPLSRDVLERISLVAGIVKGLRLLFSADENGKRWLRGTNRDVPFGGHSPLERMLRGSVADLYEVRRYIDSWRGAWP
jgi:hypothetical protein